MGAFASYVICISIRRSVRPEPVFRCDYLSPQEEVQSVCPSVGSVAPSRKLSRTSLLFEKDKGYSIAHQRSLLASTPKQKAKMSRIKYMRSSSVATFLAATFFLFRQNSNPSCHFSRTNKVAHRTLQLVIKAMTE